MRLAYLASVVAARNGTLQSVAGTVAKLCNQKEKRNETNP